MAEPDAAPLRILHAHSAFNLGGKEARAVRLMNLWGEKARHTILSANGSFGAAQSIAPGIVVDYPDNAPSLQGWPSPGRYWQLARYMRRFDLVLTYNWGSMDVVAAHRLFSPVVRLPGLIHHEDGFNEDEAAGLKPKRNHFRALMLGSARALVVPSGRLHRIARDAWRQPERRIHQIANGIDIAAYAEPPKPDAIAGLDKGDGRVVVGTLAGLRRVKNLSRLVRAVAPIKDKVRLVIVGEGDDRQAIEAEAKRLGVDVLMAGFLPDPARYVGLFDIFALSSDSEQFPISLVEAMAAGLPAVCTDVGDISGMVSPANRDYIVSCSDEAAFTAALARLVDGPDLRRAVGSANRVRAEADFDERAMVSAYARLYGSSAGKPDALAGSQR